MSFGLLSIIVFSPRAFLENQNIYSKKLQYLLFNQIAGAGIDVFVSEPPDIDHPLLALPNVVLSPHCAGVTRESLVQMAAIAAENILDAFDGTLQSEMVANAEILLGST